MVTKLARRSRRRPALSQDYDWKKIEAKARRFYASPGAKARIAKAVSGSRPVGYVEGPPTLNNQPHVGHVRGRMMKDLWYRHRTIHGENIVFRGGWDTQGLPVELQAEKELGLSGNKWEDLEKVGVDKLVAECKRIIGTYRKDWEEADGLLGLMLDHSRAYMTYRDEYIEREWSYLETAWKRGLLGEGFKVVPYCPKCQTALSAGEVSLGGYEKLEDPSLYYKAKAEDGAYLVVWTTMPFTVVTDELVGVKPGADYEYVEAGDEVWVVNSGRKEALAKELGVQFGETRKRVKGEALEGLRYQHPLLDLIPGLRKAALGGKVHRVVAEEYVDVTTGTGLVHMSPANGEEDFAVAQRRGVPVFAPFDDRVRFTQEAGRFAGLFARDADQAVVDELKGRGAAVGAGRIVHDYPVCWRSDDRLVWLARREYFYWVDRIRADVVRAAEKVEYYFDGPKNRFLAGLAESPPWCVTRERVWGTPLPIWVCESCGEKTGAFSRKAVVAQALELPDGPRFELHRPWVDRVVLRCRKCGGRAKREPFVLDTWHNSGAAPYSSFSDREFSALVPVEFLTEAIDQTRGWAYTLLLLNVIRTGKPVAPYRAFLFQGHVLDENGQKMSKRLGNVVQGLDLLRNNPVDVARFYVLAKASPEDSVNFDPKEMSGRAYQVMNTLYHLHLYLQQNGAVDGYSPARHGLAWAAKRGALTTVDRWALRKLARAERDVERGYSTGRYNEAAKSLEELVIAHLSQTYVRLVRSELWDDDPRGRGRRLAIYAVLGHALRRADQLLHPIAPFATEYLYQEVFEAGGWTAPIISKGMWKGTGHSSAGAEEVVDFSLRVEDACNSARARAKLKRRWPLRRVELLVQPPAEGVAGRAKKTVSLLCNVRGVGVRTEPEGFPAAFALRANTSRVGALFKERTREVLAAIRPLEGRAALEAYFSGKPVRAGSFDVPLSVYELSVVPGEGFEVAEKGGVFVALPRERDRKLVAEGLVRDLARRLQALRKEKGFVPTAMLGSASVAGLEAEDVEFVEPLKDELAYLVRVKRVSLSTEKAGKGWSEAELDGKPVYLRVG
ncbi:MAG: class I tRNA ligase family protein [Nitrososphaerota archaeon]|nr:class I tRNA ligase family protein [Nitrososphaerota archaeon]MDG6956267.1 class I tRNA ligase family protein [Nitrososphaerota archaeon]MDG6959415.1 class I tRNA ligase family protein [Nitrososphaerota archaeon]MDG7014802.1 class I tRNA ligase family protein [Nitrososphaerota archaeon]WGO50767.1 MAG: class I tRNA ligase family protein [Nitrososphaerota archaeon]